MIKEKPVKSKGNIMLERADQQFWAYAKSGLPEEKNKDLVLLDNVQFIYELSLAELELTALGVDFEVTNPVALLWL